MQLSYGLYTLIVSIGLIATGHATDTQYWFKGKCNVGDRKCKGPFVIDCLDEPYHCQQWNGRCYMKRTGGKAYCGGQEWTDADEHFETNMFKRDPDPPLPYKKQPKETPRKVPKILRKQIWLKGRCTVSSRKIGSYWGVCRKPRLATKTRIATTIEAACRDKTYRCQESTGDCWLRQDQEDLEPKDKAPAYCGGNNWETAVAHFDKEMVFKKDIDLPPAFGQPNPDAFVQPNPDAFVQPNPDPQTNHPWSPALSLSDLRGKLGTCKKEKDTGAACYPDNSEVGIACEGVCENDGDVCTYFIDDEPPRASCGDIPLFELPR